MKATSIIHNSLSIILSQRGQSLVELLVAIGLAAVLLPALLTGLVASREGKAQEGQRLQATTLLREAEEAVMSVREKGWLTFATDGTYHPVISGSEWSLVSGSETINGYTRQIVISNTQRDSGGSIVSSGGTVDSSTKKVVTTVSWSTPFASSVGATSYFQRYLGNTAFTHTSQSDFSGGANNNTEVTAGGEVRLTQSASTTDFGNKFLVTATSSIGNMTTTTTKTSLRFTAQEGKTVNAIRVYLHSEVGTSPTYRYGIQANSSGNPSGTYLGSGALVATSTGWKTITLSPAVNIIAGTVYHIVVEYASGTISTSRYVALRRTSPQNLLYPKTNIADSQANTLFNSGAGWSTQGFQPMYELDFSDNTYEGNPYESNTEISVFGSNWYGERFTFSGADKTSQSVSFCVRKNGSPPSNLEVVLRDSANSTLYSGTLITSAAAPTSYTCPASWQTHTFSPGPITLTAGTVYRIIIQTSGGTNTNSYRFQRLNTTNAANYTSITYDGTNSVYTASTNSGSSWTDTNYWEASFYFTVQSGGGYATNGDFTSHASGSFDAGSAVAFNNLTWSADVPGGTTFTFQIAISNNPAGPWDYFGADGVIGSSFTSPSPIPLNRINGRYLRYKAVFTSDGTTTPVLNDVSINYSP